jgi:hypothetical protein
MKSRIWLISDPSALSHSSSMTIASSLVRAETKETSPFNQRHMNIGTPHSTPLSASPPGGFNATNGNLGTYRLIAISHRRRAILLGLAAVLS